ncbi:AAA domain-containing protein [Methylobacterium phyllosphaerae]
MDSRYLAFPFLMIRSGETTKPRLAPVLLWPVSIEWQNGAGSGPTLMFDRDREEVRLNPALEAILGTDAFGRWRTARDELLAREAIRLGDVMDVFGSLANPRGRSLTSLPGKDAQAPPGATLIPAATLFNVEFTGQAVAGDLRQMRRRPPAGTALEATLRVSDVPPASDTLPPSPELSRYITMESDPSQDLAVLRSRQAPGLLVEGPPGTGKSQTIVNIISDAIGRSESVLIVCQKQAALRVVEKRLQAEGLGDRLFLVGDINRDRTAILSALREQLQSVRQASPAGAAVRRLRSDKAARIEQLESELDRYHEALHTLDDRTGLSYRDLVGELIAVEAAGPRLEAPALRSLLGPLDREAQTTIVAACTPLVRLWLEANYEGNPLSALRSFAVDEAVAEELAADLAAFRAAEQARDAVLARGTPPFDIDDQAPHRAWLASHGESLRELPDDARIDLRDWLDLFRPQAEVAPRGQALIKELDRLRTALAGFDVRPHDGALFGSLASLDADTLAAQLTVARAASAPAATFLQRLSPGRWRSRRSTRSFLTSLGQAADEAAFGRLRDALSLETNLRPLRRALEAAEAELGRQGRESLRPLEQLRRDAASLRQALTPVATAAAAVHAAPRPRETEAMVRQGTRAAVETLLAGYELAFARHAVRQVSLAKLEPLARWFESGWLEARASAVRKGESTSEAVAAISDHLSELSAYQRFRARASSLPPLALDAFARLRPKASGLTALPPDAHAEAVQHTLVREGLLSWKTQFEGRWPELGLEREELGHKIAALASLDAEMRSLNRQLLTIVDPDQLGSASAWDAVTRLRGPRALRLREIIDQGAELGLMRLRPVWLMNPDVASRLLPLRPGLFDVVIFDEASQMPVEHAVPSLFRAKRTVISGDEKQMPPSSFFSSRAEEDEDDVEIADIEDSTDAERSALEERWARRDVQSCPDLLQLGRSVLPVAALQIHYRSAFRELIGYSNGGFYNNTLSVPARHPDEEVRRAAPIEVIRADGIYEDQTNAKEAAEVVAVLARLWASPPEQRPSVGVVTFNRKQADCVEKAILDRATDDAAFRQSLERERDRTQKGEDMGFFVKNVENVQGDERDVIIFSTTFGRDSRGTFRRNFGVLGQTGGERRLNVAVTRARSKIVLITSMPVKDVSDWLAAGRAPDKPRDYLQAYLDYASKVASGDLEGARSAQSRLSRQGPRPGKHASIASDGFAASVADYVRSLGHKPVAAAQDGDAFGLDFAIEHPATGLFGIGIECDAPRHPLLARARAREIWRPAVLGRSVPNLHRVSSAAWYTRRAEEEKRLQQAIQSAVGERRA